MPPPFVNVHSLARAAVSALHPEEDILLYQSIGSLNNKGRPKPVYAPPVPLRAQIQSDGGEDISAQDMTPVSPLTRRFYLNLVPDAPDSARGEACAPAGLIRPLSRSGDLIFRPGQNTWWLVTGLAEDFSASGWVAVRAVMQTNPPEL